MEAPELCARMRTRKAANRAGIAQESHASASSSDAATSLRAHLRPRGCWAMHNRKTRWDNRQALATRSGRNCKQPLEPLLF
eukprot:3965824-Alexandrium_andersonii.AAC.1